MSDLEQKVAAHYTTGQLFERICDAVALAGTDPSRAVAADLKACDEFHTGGVEATRALIDRLELAPGTRVLDLGSGLGGTCRLLADEYGAACTGVDITPEFVETARRLTELVALSDRIEYRLGSVLDLPLGNSDFDLALLLHVGMNISNKAHLIAECARVLRPGGVFAVFDVMSAGGAGDLRFPMPWAETAETSFVEAPEAYIAAAEDCGFTLVSRTDRSAFAKDFFARVFRMIEENGPPPLGIHLMMGGTAQEKIANYVANLDAGRIAPTELVFRLS